MATALFAPDTRRPTMVVLQMVLVAAAYYGAARLGLLREVVVDGAVITPLWLPTGVALSALLYLGLRVWPGIAAGALLSISTISGTLTQPGVTIAAGNTLAPVCAFLLLRRVGFRPELDRLRDGAALVFLGAMVAMLVSASTGCATLAVTGKLPLRDFWPVWSAWWTGDVMGVLVATPVLLVLRRARLPRAGDRWLEATALAVAAVVVTLLATRNSLPLLFLVFPLLIWAALRFQLPGSAPCACLVSVFAVLAATEYNGPFRHRTLFEATANVAVFNGSVALTALLLAAIVTEQQNIRSKIELACLELADLVEQLAPGQVDILPSADDEPG
ncbi:MASE1 domain-containing protein [Streptomyces sp. NPDC090052]|uniref:MASE1 domain-containing protein n=1 Tax=unclassified Streptomyces TaxID=2593676 RepID=UPI00224F69A2|nr:MASE1 domain-containing protein [Streptomyces sp. NBC_01306]MCX4722745.1 MASE1 domain-containing protein [Streptomyces sp. NBC_01306]WSX45707.1 MASE1 domain-containing protein [Streptomyces sp. NBC_00963]